MDAKVLLEQLLHSGKKLAEQGKFTVEDKLDIPAEGSEREAMLSGLGKGALAAGALALLLGTRSGRRLGGTALKLGSLAAVGGVAYKAYQNWQKGQMGTESANVVPVNQLEGAASDKRSLILLKAMIAAAKADGHIDDAELVRIRDEIQSLGLDDSAVDFFREEVRKPLDVNEVASAATDSEMAAELYLASRLMVDMDQPEERAYMEQLTQALKLDAALVRELEKSTT